MKRLVTPEVFENIKQDVESGLKTVEIAELRGLSRTTITHIRMSDSYEDYNNLTALANSFKGLTEKKTSSLGTRVSNGKFPVRISFCISDEMAMELEALCDIVRKKVPYEEESQIKSLVLRRLVDEGLEHLVRQKKVRKIEVVEVGEAEFAGPKLAKPKRKSENEKRWELPRLWRLRKQKGAR